MAENLQSFDVSLFRFINVSLSNSFFNKLMPFLSDSPWFACLFFALAVLLAMERRGARAHLRADAGPVAVPGQLADLRLDQTCRGAIAAISKPSRNHSAGREGRKFQSALIPCGQLVWRDAWCCWFITAALHGPCCRWLSWSVFRGFTTGSIIRATCWPGRFWGRVTVRRSFGCPTRSGNSLARAGSRCGRLNCPR